MAGNAGDPNCPNQPHERGPHRYCACGWIEDGAGATDELEQARGVARELLAVCPIRNLPLGLMWRLRDNPELAWIWPAENTATGTKRKD